MNEGFCTTHLFLFPFLVLLLFLFLFFFLLLSFLGSFFGEQFHETEMLAWHRISSCYFVRLSTYFFVIARNSFPFSSSLLLSLLSRCFSFSSGCAFADTHLAPLWFREDEARFNQPQLPVTREQVDQFKEQLRAINARPIKKVAEVCAS